MGRAQDKHTRQGGLETDLNTQKVPYLATFCKPRVLPRVRTSWRQPLSHLGQTEEGTALPDAHPVAAGTGHLRARVPPCLPNPSHPRPWRRGSVFGDGPRRPLSPDERRAWIARADAERRAGRLTALHLLVAGALLKRLGVDGQCDPSHATLARDAGCDPSSVLRVLKALRGMGLLTWERRLVRRPWPAGGPGATRAEQTSNAYELLLPDRAVAPRQERPCRAVRLRPGCDRQAAGETSHEIMQRRLPDMTPETLKRMASLSQARTEKLNAEWLAKRAERQREQVARFKAARA